MLILSNKVSRKLPQKSLEKELTRAKISIEKLKVSNRLLRERRFLRHTQSKVGHLLYDIVIGALEDK